jgi:hypothetical protein
VACSLGPGLMASMSKGPIRMMGLYFGSILVDCGKFLPNLGIRSLSAALIRASRGLSFIRASVSFPITSL